MASVETMPSFSPIATSSDLEQLDHSALIKPSNGGHDVRALSARSLCEYIAVYGTFADRNS